MKNVESNPPPIHITKRLEFDAGHRLPFHHSKCKNLHGHHYEMEITLEGFINTSEGESSCGMVIDFSDLKKITEENIISPWDHAFFVYKKDNDLLSFLNTQKNHKTVITELPPTAEHLAHKAYEILKKQIHQYFGSNIKISSLKLYETPTSWAEIKSKNE